MSAVSIRCVVAFIGLSFFSAASSAADPDTSSGGADLAQYYGFRALELFEVNQRAGSLIAGDFNSDQREDLVLIDNRESCLRLFRQRTEPQQNQVRRSERVNDLRSDWRFDIQEIPVDKQIAGLAAGDFNQDGRLDLACIGLPDRLIIRYQPEPGQKQWSESWSVRLPGLEPVSWMISSGDLNSDGHLDLVVLGKTSLYVVYQNAEGRMEPPARFHNTSSQLSLVQAADINGDGRDDLCYMANEGSTRGLCARLQAQDGRLGPEICFDLQQPRSVTIAGFDDVPGREILTIDQRTGRLLVSRLTVAAEPDASAPRPLVHFGIGDGKSAGQNRAIAVGDVDGDQHQDVVVTDPENAQVLLFRQNDSTGLGSPEVFPSLLGATSICTTDLDADGRDEVLMMSDTEGVVAFSRFDQGRLTFPKTITRAQEGKSLLGIQVLPSDSGPRLVVCTRPKQKKRGQKEQMRVYQLTLNRDGSAGESDRAAEFPAEGVAGNRGLTLMTMDVNADDQQDLLLVPRGTGSKGVTTLLTDRNGLLSEKPLSRHLNLGKGVAGALFVSGRQVLTAREGFARAMVMENARWTVADQFNASEEKARIAGAVTMDYDHDGTDETVLIDTGARRLRILRNESGLFRPWQEVELGPIRFRSAMVTDLNGDQADDLLLFGQHRISILYSGNTTARLEEVASWESDRDESYPADIVAGDINGDDVIDLTLIDTAIDGVQILSIGTDQEIQSATHFRVFEEKRLVTSSDARGTEPREVVIADVTGDGRKDLVLLCHDQLILYPQDSGNEP